MNKFATNFSPILCHYKTVVVPCLYRAFTALVPCLYRAQLNYSSYLRHVFYTTSSSNHQFNTISL